MDTAGIIPAPVFVETKPDTLLLNDTLTIFIPSPDANQSVIQALERLLTKDNGFSLTWLAEKNDTTDIIFEFTDDDRLGDEGYILDVAKNQIKMAANTPHGLFYAMQSLRQLLPAEIENRKRLAFPLPVKNVTIIDKPRFGWRGMHLDVSRHFRTKDEVLRYIDLIAMHKMNIFHWHLIDDQGWRIAIEKYPRLTEIGAWRADREGKNWRERKPQQPGEEATIGGFYTQDEIREVVQYAKDRYITVIPEIEMPAHVTSALAAYPELSCTGGPFTVPTGSIWPITDIYCAGKEETFEFLENVLTEVMELFPSEYIHIGGDEAFKLEWERCDDCQARIKNEGLKDEAELQSYFIQRIEKFLNGHNRKLIGWDEILEGGLSPNATVMSWRGEEGGIKAAKTGHDAIMSPVSTCYFDYYQANPATEPEAIGGYTTLKEVYDYEPIPHELNKREAKHILGAQGNVWTEYMPTYKQVEYMAVPRMTALAEVVWSPATHRNWQSFHRRIQSFFKRLDAAGHHYSLGLYEVIIKPEFDNKSGEITVSLETEYVDPVIKYTLDGSLPTTESPTYDAPFVIKSSALIRAVLVNDPEVMDRVAEQQIILHKGLGKMVTYTYPYHKRYPADGNYSLVNGIKGTKYFKDGRWQGFLEYDLEAVVDLVKPVKISKIAVDFIAKSSSRVLQPGTVRMSISADGKEYEVIEEFHNLLTEDTERDGIESYTYTGEPVFARYVKITGENKGQCPDWHSDGGEKAWVFADEIVIE